MRLNQLREPVINFFPNFVRHHRFKRRLGEFNCQIQVAPVTDVDDFAIGIASLVHCTAADKKARNLLDWFLRRGQTDPLEWLLCERGQTLDAQGKVRPAPVVHDGVDLVHNQRSHLAQHAPAGFRSEQQI